MLGIGSATSTIDTQAGSNVLDPALGPCAACDEDTLRPPRSRNWTMLAYRVRRYYLGMAQAQRHAHTPNSRSLSHQSTSRAVVAPLLKRRIRA